jgi:hypothetical protein
MVQAITLVQAGKAPLVYQGFVAGVAKPLEEPQWTRLTALDGQRYHSQEVYNLYVDAQGRTEYFVQEFTVDLSDTLGRREVRDYRFRTTADTAYYTNLSTPGLRVLGRWATIAGLPIYEMQGFEYLDSPDHGQLKYWTPEVGTILQYFGQGETFELVQTGDQSLNRRVAQARDQIRAQWVPAEK